MDLTWGELSKALLNKKLTEIEIVNNLKRINNAFTKDRSLIGEYVESEDLVSAYSLFYLPTNIPKFNFLIEQLSPEAIEDLSNATFVDIGCGPGTYVFAFLEFLISKSSDLGVPNNKIYGIDRSELMLKQAREFKKVFFPKANTLFTNKVPHLEDDNKKVLFFGHSLNEMGIDTGLEIIKKIDPDYIFIVEPGTPAVFEFIIELRSAASKRGYKSLYPCSNIVSNCPVANKNKADWCHQVIKMVHGADIERLSQLISRDRKTMPMIGHVYCKNDVNKIIQNKSSEVLTGRVVRVLKDTKFSFSMEICIEKKYVCASDLDSLDLAVVKIEILKKQFSKKELKSLKKLNVGIAIEFEIIKVLSDESWRVNVLKGMVDF